MKHHLISVSITAILVTTLSACSPLNRDLPPTPVSTSTSTLQPTSTPSLILLTNTPTSDVTQFTSQWKQFTSRLYNLSFEYPAIYDEQPYSSCRPYDESDGQIFFAENDTLAIWDADGESLTSFVQRNIYGEFRNVTFQTENKTVAGLPAISVKDDQGLLIITTLIRDDKAYLMIHEQEIACEVPQINLTTLDAYDHLLNTLQFKLSATTTDTPTDTPMPSAALLGLAGKWNRFADANFSFEYPAAYDNAQLKTKPCSVSELNASVYLARRAIGIGDNVSIWIYDAKGKSLEEQVKLLGEDQGPDFSISRQTPLVVGGQSAVRIDYQFHGLLREGIMTVMVHSNQLYSLDYTDLGQCDIPEINLTGTEVYEHLLSSFQFLK